MGLVYKGPWPKVKVWLLLTWVELCEVFNWVEFWVVWNNLDNAHIMQQFGGSCHIVRVFQKFLLKDSVDTLDVVV